MRRPLVVTADPDLLDDLLRLAAAGGTEVDVAADPSAARARHPGAPFVLIGADQTVACLRARLPRRSRMIIVGHGEIDDTVWESAELIGAEHVVVLPTAESWLVEQFTRRAATAGPAARTVAVIGGRGGAGASILATGLATTAVRAGHRTLLLDADPLGGGLDLALGWEQRDGLRWRSLADADGRVDPQSLIKALPSRGDLVLLSFDRKPGEPTDIPAEAMAATMDAARRGRDVIVADLPRRLDDAAVVALENADRALLVVPAEVRAAASAERTAKAVAQHCADVAVVVRGPAPGRLRARDIVHALKLPLAGTLRPDPAMCHALEFGTPPAADGKGPLAELCRRLVDELLRGPGQEAAA
jgi:secretion/DNA translocation related CpaE-like protein